MGTKTRHCDGQCRSLQREFWGQAGWNGRAVCEFPGPLE
jgi:hypothetical protein